MNNFVKNDNQQVSKDKNVDYIYLITYYYRIITKINIFKGNSK
jgi:hypothetical protein